MINSLFTTFSGIGTNAELISLCSHLELASTLMLTGLIWMVQIVHYPLLAYVGKEGFTEYERRHCSKITWVVAPLMFTELASCLGLAFLSGWDPKVCGRLGLIIVIWFSTAFIQVPLHQRLEKSRDDKVIASLVATNWIRTVAWTVRSLLIF